MKKIILFILLTMACFSLQAQKLQWLRPILASTADPLIPQHVYMHKGGLLYIITNLDKKGIFGADTIIPDSPSSIIISGFDSSGYILPAVKIQQPWSSFTGNAMAKDDDGNLFIAGAYHDFNANNSVILMKTDAKGKVLWSRTSGGSVRGQGICLDKEGNIFLSGYIDDSFSLDGFSYHNSSRLAWTSFICRMNPSGKVQWLKFFYGADMTHLHGDLIGNDGSLYVTGHFLGIGYFDKFKLYHSFNDPEGVLFKLDTAKGAVHFVKRDTFPASGQKFFIYEDKWGNILTTSDYGFLSLYSSSGQHIPFVDSIDRIKNYYLTAGMNRDGEVLAAYYDSLGERVFLRYKNAGGNFLSYTPPITGPYTIDRIIPLSAGNFYLYGTWKGKIALEGDTILSLDTAKSQQFVALLSGLSITGIESHDVVDYNSLSIFPNPNNGEFNYQFNKIKSGAFKAILIDCYGREIFSENIILQDNKFGIHTSLPSGLYILRICFKDGTQLSRQFTVAR
jgi:hypothetical protein